MSTDWSIFKESASTEEGESVLLLPVSAELPFENTSVSQHSILLPDSHLMLWAPTACQTLIFVERRGSYTVSGEMEWTLSTQRHPAMAPELQEPLRRPLRALNYYHVYTLGSLLCARFKFWSVLSCLLTYLWNFEKHSSKILFWEFFSVSLKNLNLFRWRTEVRVC